MHKTELTNLQSGKKSLTYNIFLKSFFPPTAHGKVNCKRKDNDQLKSTQLETPVKRLTASKEPGCGCQTWTAIGNPRFHQGKHCFDAQETHPLVFIIMVVVVSILRLCPTLWPHGLWPARLLCPWDFPGKNTGVGCYFLLQGTFPTQGSNLSLVSPAFRQTLPTTE